MENDKKEKLMGNIKKFINDLAKAPGTTVTDVDSESSILLPKIANHSKQFPAFSDAIELKYEAGRGRFGVASRDIKLGKNFVTSANKCFHFAIFICIKSSFPCLQMVTTFSLSGELLCVEKQPVFYLHEETSGVNCSNCFRESIAPLPSPTCTQTVFCSRNGFPNYISKLLFFSFSQQITF